MALDLQNNLLSRFNNPFLPVSLPLLVVAVNHRIAAATTFPFSPLPQRYPSSSIFRFKQVIYIYSNPKAAKKGFINQEKRRMSRRNGAKLDLKLNLSPPRMNMNHRRVESPSRSLTVSPTSPLSSCVSSELNQQDEYLRYSTSPEATSMMLVGCPRCLMYVMLSEEEPRCPKCKSTVLLDVIHDKTTTTAAATAARKPKKS